MVKPNFFPLIFTPFSPVLDGALVYFLPIQMRSRENSPHKAAQIPIKAGPD